MIQYEEMDIWRFGDEYKTRIPMDFLTGALSRLDRRFAFDYGHHPEKSKRIRKALDSGVDPLSFDPISVFYYHCQGVIYINEGNHRIQVFHERGIPTINASFVIYFSLDPLMRKPPWCRGSIYKGKAFI